MKTLFKLSLFTFFLAGVFSFAPEKALHSETLVVKTNIYCSHCMKCGTCGLLLQDSLVKEKGIQKVILDDKAMTITVTYDAHATDPGKIRTAISKLGYDADDVKADPDAYKKLDGCCQKH